MNTVKPTISGKEQVGEELTATRGTWTGGATSFSYQWQRCSTAGANCADVVGATGSTCGVRSADAANTVRVALTAKSSSGSTTATSNPTGTIESAGSTTVVVAPTPSGHRAPVALVPLAQAGRHPCIRPLQRLQPLGRALA